VLSTEAGAGTGCRANRDRYACLTARHETQFGRVIDDLIHGDRHEIHEHDFRDRPIAHQGRADGRPEDGLFGDRRGTDACGAIFGRQSLRRGEHAAALCIGDILAEQNDALIRRHRLVHG